MLFVTGDLHGDLMRLKSPEMKKLRKGDYLLVCGDFGFLWDGSRREQKLLDRLGKLKFHILFVEGAHENYRLLSQIQPTEYCGGMARVISGKLVQLCRGYVFSLCGKKIFAFGGGDNPDLDVELLDEDLPLQRLPTEQDVALAGSSLHKTKTMWTLLLHMTVPPPSGGCCEWIPTNFISSTPTLTRLPRSAVSANGFSGASMWIRRSRPTTMPCSRTLWGCDLLFPWQKPEIDGLLPFSNK